MTNYEYTEIQRRLSELADDKRLSRVGIPSGRRRDGYKTAILSVKSMFSQEFKPSCSNIAPQPMSAVEYERIARRFSNWCASRLCSECGFFDDCPHSYKKDWKMPTPEERVAAIQKWAREHPERSEE